VNSIQRKLNIFIRNPGICVELQRQKPGKRIRKKDLLDKLKEYLENLIFGIFPVFLPFLASLLNF